MSIEPKYVYGIVAGVIGTAIYFFTLRKRERERQDKLGGIMCPRCREHYSEEQLFQIDKVLRMPFKLIGWDQKAMKTLSERGERSELDGFYCARCKSILSLVLSVGYLIALPMIGSVIYLALDFLGLISG